MDTSTQADTEDQNTLFIAGEKFIAIPAPNPRNCTGCFFRESHPDFCASNPPCTSDRRKDKQTIVFIQESTKERKI